VTSRVDTSEHADVTGTSYWAPRRAESRAADQAAIDAQITAGNDVVARGGFLPDVGLRDAKEGGRS
jgi:hypothetical protein